MARKAYVRVRRADHAPRFVTKIGRTIHYGTASEARIYALGTCHRVATRIELEYLNMHRLVRAAVGVRVLFDSDFCHYCGAIDGERGCAECRPEAPAPAVVREPWRDADVQAAKRERDERAPINARALAADALAWHEAHMNALGQSTRTAHGAIYVQRDASALARGWRAHGRARFDALREGYAHAYALTCYARNRGDAHALPEHVQQWARTRADECIPDGMRVHVQWDAPVICTNLGQGFIVPAFVYVDAPDWMDDDGADGATNEGNGNA